MELVAYEMIAIEAFSKDKGKYSPSVSKVEEQVTE
jgi:hypothetical protein